MKNQDWPEGESPQEKLVEKGAPSLSDAELLAIFLEIGGSKKRDPIQTAYELLKSYGGLRRLLETDGKELCQDPRLGLERHAQFQAALEITKRYLWSTLQSKERLNSSYETREYLSLRLRGYEYEVFSALFLDQYHRILAFEELARGTVSRADLHVREVVKRALALNATAIIFAHNHPAGDHEPSKGDVELTLYLQKVFAAMEIRVLDHIIVGEAGSCSLAEQNLLDRNPARHLHPLATIHASSSISGRQVPQEDQHLEPLRSESKLVVHRFDMQKQR